MAGVDAVCVAYATVRDGVTETAVIKFLGVPAQFAEMLPGGMQDHPFAARGLAAPGAFEVKQSSWARALGHPDARHLIVAVEDRTVDVLCARVGFRFAGTDDAEDAAAASYADGALKWWLLTAAAPSKSGKPMQRDWLKDDMLPGIGDVEIYLGDNKSAWQRFADWIAQRQMRRAFGRRRMDL
ncbi:MAG: hypothetical protein VW268_10740 [Rhodospirillaceae bacterium]